MTAAFEELADGVGIASGDPRGTVAIARGVAARSVTVDTSLSVVTLMPMT